MRIAISMYNKSQRKMVEQTIYMYWLSLAYILSLYLSLPVLMISNISSWSPYTSLLYHVFLILNVASNNTHLIVPLSRNLGFHVSASYTCISSNFEYTCVSNGDWEFYCLIYNSAYVCIRRDKKMRELIQIIHTLYISASFYFHFKSVLMLAACFNFSKI